MTEPVHIIGAGVAGLGAAEFLADRGIPSIIHEAGGHIGGRAACIDHGGRAMEIGGKNFSTAWVRFNRLLDKFGITEFEPQHPGFHIVMNDALIGLQKERTLSGDLRLASVLGFRGAIEFKRFLDEAREQADALNYSAGAIEEIERRYDWAPVSHHFRDRVCRGPFRLFSIIMGAAEPDEVYPSLLALFASGFGKGMHLAVKGGVGRFHDALAHGKTIRFGSQVERIAIQDGRVRGITVNSQGQRHDVPCERVIAAVPAHVMRRLIDLPAYARVALDKIRYFPLALINAVYDGPVFRDGVNSVMFEPGVALGHCSANRIGRPDHVRYTLSGRAAREILDREDNELIEIAEKTFNARLPIEANRVDYHVARHQGGICAYAPFFTQVKRDLAHAINDIQGVEIAGDYLEGHTMEGCLTSADYAVERLCKATNATSQRNIQLVA